MFFRPCLGATGCQETRDGAKGRKLIITIISNCNLQLVLCRGTEYWYYAKLTLGLILEGSKAAVARYCRYDNLEHSALTNQAASSPHVARRTITIYVHQVSQGASLKVSHPHARKFGRYICSGPGCCNTCA
jgi:hypothetical protein